MRYPISVSALISHTRYKGTLADLYYSRYHIMEHRIEGSGVSGFSNIVRCDGICNIALAMHES